MIMDTFKSTGVTLFHTEMEPSKNRKALFISIGVVTLLTVTLAIYLKFFGNKDGDNSNKKVLKKDGETQLKPSPEAKTLSEKEEENYSYEKLIQKRAIFEDLCSPFTITSNTIEAVVEKSADKEATQHRIVEQAKNAKIIIDERVRKLAEAFLLHKKTNGNEVEKAVYTGMSLDGFINRLIRKRPLAFLGSCDNTWPRTKAHQAMFMSKGKTHYYCKNAEWRIVGTPKEQKPLVLEEYLSYEEMEISALVSISVPTFFINKGGRKNKGVPGEKGTFTEEGIYVGAVGARFHHYDLMESKYLLIPKSINPPPILFEGWRKLYNLSAIRPADVYLSVPEDSTYFKTTSQEGHLNNAAFRLRMEFSYRPFILHAQAEGDRLNKQMILRLTGLGTGVWAINDVHQDRQIFLTVQKIIKENRLPRIDRVEFMWMHAPAEVNPTAPREGATEVKDANGKAIKVIFSESNPADLKPMGMEEHMVMAMYAWDSNSFSGNEYWINQLDTSGDPAATCCSTIQELQNPYINTQLSAPAKLASY